MNDAEEIKTRLYRVLPAMSMQMDKLLRLFDVRLSTTETQTAAVTCETRPTLLLNPEFIAQYCKTDEHLFCLVMHEMYHIILGHTTLFPRTDDRKNLAFDAVINAMICREFPRDEYTSFFTQYYSSPRAPFCLLRPPDGNESKASREVLGLLYGTKMATYHDVFLALDKMAEAGEIEYKITMDGSGKPLLIGDHGDGASSAENDPTVQAAIREIGASWPRPDNKLKGRGAGGPEEMMRVAAESSSPELKAAMMKLLNTASIRLEKARRERRNFTATPVEATLFMPTVRDRTATARRLLQGEILSYNTTLAVRRPERKPDYGAFVYLDVSGSMEDVLPRIAPLLARPYKRRELKLFVFSTEVMSVKPIQVFKGELPTTGGTDISCVIEHLAVLKKRERPRRAIIVTDGYTGSPSQKQAALLKRSGIKIDVSLTADGSKADLKSIADNFTRLPL